jgi:cholesterol oxidase
MTMSDRWDYIVVGSGFGGSVAALRLLEAGHRVLMLEQGHRFDDDDFARTTWNLRRWLWAPSAGLRGPFRMSFLRHITALSGVGVGGGSLVYGGVLQKPLDDFFDTPSWGHLRDWRQELGPHYRTALRMLGAAQVPNPTYPDELVGRVAASLGREAHHTPTTVSVYFGEPGEEGQAVPDPYFDGQGPDRAGCIACGGCFVGCRHQAKNSLDRNYLWLAEKNGLELRTESEVTAVRPDAGGYVVEVRQGRRPWPRKRRTYHASRVILAAGVLGTVPLLLRMRDRGDGLPDLSPAVGDFVRTNSEVLMGIVAPDKEMSDGVSISSILEVSDHATLEPVRYSRGSGALRLLAGPHSPGDSTAARLSAAARRVARHPVQTLRALFVRDWARRTLILLYMSTNDSHLRLELRRGPGAVTTRVARGTAPTASIPEATRIGEQIAADANGYPISLVVETLRGTPTTAHLLGGCVMSDSPETGVIGPDHQVWNYPGLFVIDASAMPANPGVNPSLTITAMAERALAGITGRTEASAS